MRGIPLISNITQQGDADFWLVDSNAIYGGLYHVFSKNQMEAIPEIRIKQGMLCYVENDDEYYKYLDGWKPWIIEQEGNTCDVITEEEIQEIMNIFKNDMD